MAGAGRDCAPRAIGSWLFVVGSSLVCMLLLRAMPGRPGPSCQTEVVGFAVGRVAVSRRVSRLGLQAGPCGRTRLDRRQKDHHVRCEVPSGRLSSVSCLGFVDRICGWEVLVCALLESYSHLERGQEDMDHFVSSAEPHDAHEAHEERAPLVHLGGDCHRHLLHPRLPHLRE